jgi:hypothetical protein
MAATTYSKISTLLSDYIEPSGDLMKSLNQVLDRLYGMGIYRDLTVQHSLEVIDAGVTLPDDADAILFVTVNNQPVPVRSLWHDFNSVGSGASTDMSWGLIDSGFWPTLKLLPEAGLTTLYVVPAQETADAVAVDTTAGEQITITARNDDGDVYEASIGSGLNTIIFSSTVTQIDKVQFTDLLYRYDIRTDAADSDTTIATLGPNSGVTRFRRYRLNRSVDGSTVVHVLCKRAFEPISGANDVVYVDNIGALKHGLLGRIAEDHADLERAQYHWRECQRLLEEEANSSRGAAIPRLKVDPFGTAGRANIRPMY